MKRRRIGLQTSRMDFGYGVRVWRGAIAAAERLDADLIIFPGRNLDTPHGFDYQYNRVFQLMNEENLDALVLMTTLVCNFIDGAALRDFCARHSRIPAVSVGLSVPGIPSIVIDNRAGVRSEIRHAAERHGARRIAYVRGPANNWEANERFAAYREELERLGIPFDPRLVAQGDFTTHSARPAVESVLERLGGLPDAFIFANDEMAIRGMAVLGEKGYSVPEDVAVAGFDDIEETANLSVPMTTVRQPLFEMGRLAVERLGEMLEGRSVPELAVLETEPVIRASCGCIFHCVEEMRSIERRIDESGTAAGPEVALEALKGCELVPPAAISAREGAIGEAYARLAEAGRPAADTESAVRWFAERMRAESRSGLDPGDWRFILPAFAEAIERSADGTDRIALDRAVRTWSLLSAEASALRRNAIAFEESSVNAAMREVQYGLSSIMNLDDLAEILRTQLPRIGIDTFFLSRFESEWMHAPRSGWDVPGRIEFVTALVDGTEIKPAGDRAYGSNALFPPDALRGGPRRTLAVFPLFFREAHLGTIVYGVKHKDGHVYESMTTQIAGVIKTVMLFQGKERAEDKLRQAMAELEGYNEQLNYLTLTDELTELYNRRGFLKLASQQLSIARQMGRRALLVFGDLDGLKAINDTHGHEEGDRAIKAVADVLKKTFRAMDIIARMGGDEFTVFVPNADESHVGLFNARIEHLIAEENAAAERPYALSMSVGYVTCLPDTRRGLDDYLREADALLYEKKKAKRKG